VREGFRHERKIRKREKEATDALRERLGTEIDILPESTEDATRAELVSFGDIQQRDAGLKDVFRSPNMRRGATKVSKSSKEDRRDALKRQLLANTRASLNPFGGNRTSASLT